MKRASLTTSLAALAVLFSCEANAQDAVEEVVEEVEVELAAEEMIVAMPADDNLLKLFAYAQVEVALVRRACDLSDEQLTAVAEIDNAWVRKISTRQGNAANANGQQPGLIAMFFGARPAANNPPAVAKSTVKKKIQERVAEILTDEQKEIYEKEQQLRDQFRREATADALIESLQPRLGMTEEQRAEIKAKIAPWVDRSNLTMMYYFSGNNYYPNIPEHLLSQTLDKDQMAAYRGLQKHLFTEENFNDGNAPIVIKQ